MTEKKLTKMVFGVKLTGEVQVDEGGNVVTYHLKDVAVGTFGKQPYEDKLERMSALVAVLMGKALVEGAVAAATQKKEQLLTVVPNKKQG